MNDLARKGKFNTYRIFASVLLVSIYTIISYNIILENVETKKIIQQIIRFCLTLLLMYFVLKGKKWAVDIFTILFSLAMIMGIYSLFSGMQIWGKIPIAIMTIVYGLAVYHLNYSKSFKEYFKLIEN